jgi:hypothetical protein
MAEQRSCGAWVPPPIVKCLAEVDADQEARDRLREIDRKEIIQIHAIFWEVL